jgi:phage terminase Nu1 subunit (DNA packaging protein)
LAEGNVNLIATLFNLTPRRVQQLANEGMPKADRGNYDVRACTMWYIRYMQGQLLKRQDDEVRDETVKWTRERTRLAQEQAETSALRNAEMRGELISLSILKQRLGHVFGNIRQNTLALGSKIAPECEARSAIEIKEIIDREARILLESLASFDLRTVKDRPRADADSEDPDAASENNGEPVGRRKPNPKPRGKRRAGKVANRKS